MPIGLQQANVKKIRAICYKIARYLASNVVSSYYSMIEDKIFIIISINLCIHGIIKHSFEHTVLTGNCKDIKSTRKCKKVKRKGKCTKGNNKIKCAKTCGFCTQGKIV